MKLKSNSWWLLAYRIIVGNKDYPNDLCTFLRMLVTRAVGWIFIILFCTIIVGAILSAVLVVIYTAIGSVVQFFWNYNIPYFNDKFYGMGVVFSVLFSFFGIAYVIGNVHNRRVYRKWQEAYDRRFNGKEDGVIMSYLKGIKNNFCPTLEIVDSE